MKLKAVKDWEDRVRDFGCVVTGQNDVQIHHVHGRKYKNNKVLIGPWFILPLCMKLHDVHSNDINNVTHYPKMFAQAYGLQRDLFLEMCDDLAILAGLPFDLDVLEAIKLTRR